MRLVFSSRGKVILTVLRIVIRKSIRSDINNKEDDDSKVKMAVCNTLLQ